MHKTQTVNELLEVMATREEEIRPTFRTASVPVVLEPIRQQFIEAMEKGTSILIENSELNAVHSVAIKLSYIGERWCLGYETLHHLGQEIKIPYTVHYTDLYTNKESGKIKVIFEGENPFG